MVIEADIVVASYKPGDPEKLGVSYEQLSAINPGLIYGHITGYGSDDPRVGYDAVLQAEAGFMSMNGEKEGSPLKMPVALVDVLAAHHLKQGLLLALINRMNTGEGSYVTISLIDAAVSSLANQGTNWLVGGKVPGRKGNQHPNIAPYGDVFTTEDGAHIILAVGSDKQFNSLCKVLGVERDDRFTTNTRRVENREPLIQALEEKIKLWSTEDLLSVFAEKSIPAGKVKSIDEVMDQNKAQWFLDAESTGVRTLMALPDFLEPLNLSPPPQLGGE